MKPLYIVSIVLFIFSLSLGISEPLRDTTRQLFISSESKVLSAIKGVPITSDLVVDIYKIKEDNIIVVKFFHSDSGAHFQTFSLQDAWDGYYQVNGRNTNLFLNDIDQDRTLEVLIPTFDQNLSARMHILKYDQSAGSFYPFPL